MNFGRITFGRESLRIFPRNRPRDTIILDLGTPNLPLLIWLWQHLPAVPAVAEPTPKTSASQPRRVAEERVPGFPDEDPELGRLLCGVPRPTALVYSCLALAGVVLVFGVILYLHTGPGCLGGAWLCFFLGLGIAAVAWLDFGRVGCGIYEHGLRGTHGRLRWNECEHVTYAGKDVHFHGHHPPFRIFLFRSFTLKVEGARTTVRICGSGARTEGYCTTVLDRVLPILVARRLEQLRGGEPFRVSRVILTRDGIVSRRARVRFAEIQAIDVQQDVLYVWAHGRREPIVKLNANRRDVPVLLALVQRLMRSADELRS
jgi:hypothetical protein